MKKLTFTSFKAIDMNTSCNTNIRKAFDLVRQMIILSDEGEAQSTDNGCALLYGVIRDCAYRIRSEAEREKEQHMEQGNWEQNGKTHHI